MENWTSIMCYKIIRLPLRIILLLVFLVFNCGTGTFAIAVDQNDDDFAFKDNDIRKIQNPKINVLDQNMTGFTNVVLAGSDGNDILVNSQDGDGRSQEPLAESSRQRFDRLKRYVGDIFGGWLGGSPTNLDEPESSGSTIDGLKRIRIKRQAPKDNDEDGDDGEDDGPDDNSTGGDDNVESFSRSPIPPTQVTTPLEFTKTYFRIYIKLGEPFIYEFNDHSSTLFQEYSRNVTWAFGQLLSSPDFTKVTLINVISTADLQACKAIIDLEISGKESKDQIEGKLYKYLEEEGKLGTLKAFSDDLYVRDFEEVVPFQCSSDIPCRDVDKCYTPSQRCNQQKDCPDHSDEQDCPPLDRCRSDEKYSCPDGSGVVICSIEKCDRKKDCPSGADEQSCSPEYNAGNGACHREEIRCHDGACIDSSKKCDNVRDCSGGEDELHCDFNNVITPEPPPTPAECQYDEFQCSDGHCIPSFRKCDFAIDCMDGSDEYDCPSTTTLTTPSTPVTFRCNIREFRCSDGHCIPLKRRCDDFADCRDGSDELYGCLREPEGQLFLKAYPKEQIIKESQEAVFQCRDEGLLRAPITWTRSGEQLLPVNSRVHSDGRLEIPNIQLSQAGTYICKANEPYSRLPGSQISVELEVEPCVEPEIKESHYGVLQCNRFLQCIFTPFQHYPSEIVFTPPSFVKSPEPIELLTAGETFIINCSANGVPTPDIVWRLNWEKVPVKCKTTNRNGTGTLTCPNIQREDEGIYRCIAIYPRGFQFAQPDCGLTVKEVPSDSASCLAHQFNYLATDPRDCIDCFCFGQSIECKSSNLSVSVVQVPLRGKSDQIARIGFKSTYGEISVSSNSSDLISLQTAVEGDTLRVWSNVPTYPYLNLTQDFSGNQINSYGGYIRFSAKYNADPDVNSPLIIISGNGNKIFYNGTEYFSGLEKTSLESGHGEIRARVFYGAWFKEGSGPNEGNISSIVAPTLASREDIMKIITKVDQILIKLQYSSSQQIDTLVSDIRIDTATARGTSVGPNKAVYVEECRCPLGYIGLSCESCDTGYRRIDDGNLGSCIAESCPDGQFGDPLRGIQCKDCPCPLSNPTNQFGRTCYLGADKKAVCHCPAGYSGRYCQFCAEDYVGDPLTPGSYCTLIEWW